MSYANLAQSVGPSRSTIQRASESRCGMAPRRGDVTTVRAAGYVRLQAAKRIEKLQSHAPSHRTAGTATVPLKFLKVGQA